MAFLECRFFSEALDVSVTVNVLLPQKTFSQIGLKGVADSDGAPVLYLLHGLSDDESIWLRRTSIERYATQYGLAVIMPDGGRSYYADMFHGGKYWTYLSEELPRVMQSFFRFSTKREDTFAAGLSMGGYGAMKLALHCPEKFAAAASLSGALDPMLLKVADFYEDEVDNMVASLTSALEPLLIIFLGGIVGFIVISVFMPIINITQTLSGDTGGE